MARLTHELTTHLLDKIRIPICENVNIHIDTPTKAPHSMHQSLLRIARAFMEGSDFGRVKLGAAVFEMESWKRNEVILAICLGKSWELNTANSLLQMFDARWDLDISIHTRSHDKSDLTKLLGLLPGLRGARVLRLSQHHEFTHDGLNALIGELGGR
ncbi:hypothetical protein FRB98_003101 [Tulasnella sp. 332]|nr:hypothetical protein FRB98_003101 [Tulasnella sp. 332]